MANRALGTTLKKGTGPTAKTIGGLTSIGGIEVTADTIDVTTLASAGGYREFIGAFKDAGEVPIEGFFEAGSEANQIDFQTSIDEGVAEDYEITFPTTPIASWKFKGVVTGFKVGDVDVDGTIGFGATIKVSGKPTLSITGA
ncbi:phage tail tube protein [Lachnoclostridium sp.]|nr:phage tail tube protein [Lachnoclostridium sp.]